MTPLAQSLVTLFGFVVAIFAGILGFNIGRDHERARIRARIITDQATCAADYSEAEDYADKMVRP